MVPIKSLNFKFKRVGIDNDSVLLCAKFIQVCQDGQIIAERTIPYAHWQLGRIESQWRILSEGAKTLLVTADLLDTF